MISQSVLVLAKDNAANEHLLCFHFPLCTCRYTMKSGDHLVPGVPLSHAQPEEGGSKKSRGEKNSLGKHEKRKELDSSETHFPVE